MSLWSQLFSGQVVDQLQKLIKGAPRDIQEIRCAGHASPIDFPTGHLFFFRGGFSKWKPECVVWIGGREPPPNHH